MKLTAYQKLKLENLKLKRDIYSILGENGWEYEMTAKTVWRLNIEAEKLIWGGENKYCVMPKVNC